ncbi:MAG TPA: hypothetical protein IGR64_06560 [Leptolyngbyaceae cyanobacterium M65_K2018_010]|nr:hypothetical protein [Leptolyngbyaceae cyanobacterium M65_K2018_010]
MYALAADHLLYYKISPEAGGFRLRLWETPAASTHREVNYLYILNFRVASVAEAKAVLAHHLALNGSALASDLTDLPKKGKIRLMAFPTWNGSNIG